MENWKAQVENEATRAYEYYGKAQSKLFKAIGFLNDSKPRMKEARESIASSSAMLDKGQDILSHKVVEVLKREIPRGESQYKIELKKEFEWILDEIGYISHHLNIILERIDRGGTAKVALDEVEVLDITLTPILNNLGRMLYRISTT